MSVEIKPYFATGERYPALIGVRADGDEYETAYVSKSELADAVRERDELRELVRFIMHQCNDGNPRCDECINWNDGECVALLRMRELGVDG